MSANNPLFSEYDTNVRLPMTYHLSEDFADFHFIFKSKSDDDQIERIPVHKIILATGSDVFRVMFNGSLKEKVDVEIVDSSADAFKEFLQFFYLPKAKVTIENVAEVMNLGKKYDVIECFNACGQFLQENLSIDDICFIYELANHLEHKELEKRCEYFVERNIKAICKSDSFLRCDQKTVKRILQMDSLCCSETEVFESLINWIKSKIEPEELTKEIIQGQFSDLIHEIRFRSMNLDEFTSFVPLYGALLTSEELQEIVQMIHSDQFQPKLLKANRRNNFESFQWNEDAVIICDRSAVLYICPAKNTFIDKTTFTVNKPVALRAFRSSRLINFNGQAKFSSIEITIFEIVALSNPNKLVVYNEIKKLGEGIINTLYTERIVLKNLILIRPEYKYEIQIKKKNTPVDDRCAKYELGTVVHIKPDITVQFYNNPTNRSINMLEFNRI